MRSAPLSISPPFDAKALFARLAFTGNRTRLISADPERQRLSRPVTIGNKVMPLVIEFTGSTEEPLASIIVPEDADASQTGQLLSVARHIISADVDLEAFYRRFAEDEMLRPLIDSLRGSKLLLDPDPFESLIRTIICQQLNLSFAGTLIERLAQLAGEEMAVDGKPMLAFPSAERIAALSVEQLRECSFSQRKAEYVIDAARLIACGGIDFGRLTQLSDEDVIAELTKIRGIGRWTVECLLIFGFGRPDLLPAADIGLRNGVKKVYGLDFQPSAAEVESLGSTWAPWRTYVTYYMWEALRLPK